MVTVSSTPKKLLLDRTKTVVIAGAGPYGLTAALALVTRLKDNAPHIVLVEPCDLESCEHWEPCKGCAGGILRGTIQHLISTYDTNHIAASEREGITVRTPEGKKYLSRSRVDEIAFHMPHDLPGLTPMLKFTGPDVITPTFRVEGPRYIHDEWIEYNHIGFSPFMFQMLKSNYPNVELVQGRIRMVDTDGDRPVVDVRFHDKERLVEADHVLINTGISKSKPPMVKENGVVRDLPHVQTLKTLMLSTEVPRNPRTERIFHIRRGPIDYFRAHLFVTEGPAHYILTMPKVVGDRIALTVATFGQEMSDAVMPEDVAMYLASHPAFKDSGIRFDVNETYCHCGALIPSSTLPADQQYGKGYSLGGDVAGGLRLWKNGIGTAIIEAERFVDYVLVNGYTPEALGQYFNSLHKRVVADNQMGRRLLNWVDVMLNKPALSQMLQAYLIFEQRLSPDRQWLLPIFGATTTGKVSYQELARMLHRGLRGSMLKEFASVIQAPMP